jgi:hypothetical protein
MRIFSFFKRERRLRRGASALFWPTIELSTIDRLSKLVQDASKCSRIRAKSCTVSCEIVYGRQFDDSKRVASVAEDRLIQVCHFDGGGYFDA